MFRVDKKSWENFWYYYRVHTFVGIFIAIIIIITVKDCSNQINPDLTVGYINENYITDESITKIRDRFLEQIQDSNSDNKKAIDIIPFIFSKDQKSEQNMAISQKLMVMIATGELQVFFLDRESYLAYIEQGLFQSLDEIVDEGINSYLDKYPFIKNKMPDSDTEHIYAIPLQDNKLLKSMGVHTSDMYMTLKVTNASERKDIKKDIVYQNAKTIIKEIYQNR